MTKLLTMTALFFCQLFIAQNSIDSTQIKKEYTNIENALKNPEKVYRLNLSNQNISVKSVDWIKFSNLEYLNLSNDHLKTIPN